MAQCAACAAEQLLAQSFDAPPDATGSRGDDVDFIVSRLRRRLEKPSREAGQGPRQPPAEARPGSGWTSAWPLAAGILLVLGLGVAVQTLGPSAPPLPQHSPGGSVRGGGLQAIHPVGELREMPTELRWSELEDAASFRVTVMTMDEVVLWEGVSPGSPLALPRDLRARLYPAVAYFWRVKAVDPAGAVLASSEKVRFLVSPRTGSTGEVGEGPLQERIDLHDTSR